MDYFPVHPAKSSFKVPEDESMGVVDLFPFFSAANSLHPESLAFSTVCFSQELKFSSTFRKHELNMQGVFLALLLGTPQVCAGERMNVTQTSCSGLGLTSLLCISESLSHSFPLGCTLSSFILSLQISFELVSFLRSP